MASVNRFAPLAEDWQPAKSTKQLKKEAKKKAALDAKFVAAIEKVFSKVYGNTTSKSEEQKCGTTLVVNPRPEEPFVVIVEVRYEKEAKRRVQQELAENKSVHGEIIVTRRDISADALATCKMISKSSKWIRLLYTDMKHHGFKYAEGLNVDILPFNPIADCGPGGLYFCEEAHFMSWLDARHTLVADVEIPDDAQVSHMNNKSKADKIILKNIRPIEQLECLNDLKYCFNAVVRRSDGKIKTDAMLRAGDLRARISTLDENQIADLFELDPRLFDHIKKPNVTQMKKYMLASEPYLYSELSFIEKVRKLPYTHQMQLLLETVCDCPNVTDLFDSIPEEVIWQVIKKCPDAFKLDDPRLTQVMLEYILDVIPTLISRLNNEQVTGSMQLNALRKLGWYQWRNTVRLGKKFHPAVEEEIIIYKEKENEYSKLLHNVGLSLRCTLQQLPVIGKLLKPDYKVHGSFVRWFTREHLVTGQAPNMDRVYEFLGQSDLDISTYIRQLVVDLHMAPDVIVEHVELSEYRSAFGRKRRWYGRKHLDTKQVDVGALREGNYNCWIPCDKIASGWLRCDVIIEDTDSKSDDYTVNCIRFINDKLTCDDTTSLIGGLIRPVSGNSSPKKLYRVKKLLAAGYKLDENSKSMFRAAFNESKKKPEREVLAYLAVGDRCAPSSTDKTLGIIPPTGHKYVQLLNRVVFEDPEVMAVARWCEKGEPF